MAAKQGAMDLIESLHGAGFRAGAGLVLIRVDTLSCAVKQSSFCFISWPPSGDVFLYSLFQFSDIHDTNWNEKCVPSMHGH